MKFRKHLTSALILSSNVSALGATTIDKNINVDPVIKLGGAVLTVFVVIAGIKYASSADDAKQSAKNIMVAGVLIFGAAGIVALLKKVVSA
ncbi:hypothetical protein A9Q84_00295 [Halobacteriovorax marinus]|uniref:Uncharacterized protein n=1 Tax=Halobacteriovorax marinus TaxID=97084 RepID=A0A1Y5FDI3_9BACT|nr:hypothetical protein A9Q84_00295 [Halobacteriovorax marinus]